MDKFFLRHPHLDMSSLIAQGTERLLGGGSYADVYKASLRNAPTPIKIASASIGAASSIASAMVQGAMSGDSSSTFLDNTSVAMKRFRVHLTGMGNVEKMIMREFGLWAKLRHDNVLPLIGYCDYNGAPTMISPWMEGGTILDYWIKHEGEPDARPFIDIVVDITSGLAYLHANDVVHCDLKCANILSTPTGVPRLADFGISRLPSTQVTATTNGGVKGTLRWMAVELVYSPQPDFDSMNQGDDEVPAPVTAHTKMSDVWAYGMTVLELWTKEHPYRHIRNDHYIVIAIAQGILPLPPVDMSTATPEQVAMWNMCTSCWHQTPTERPEISTILNALKYLRENQAAPTVVDEVKTILTTRPRFQSIVSIAVAQSDRSEGTGPTPEPINAGPSSTNPNTAAPAEPHIAPVQVDPSPSTPLPVSPLTSPTVQPLIDLTSVLNQLTNMDPQIPLSPENVIGRLLPLLRSPDVLQALSSVPSTPEIANTLNSVSQQVPQSLEAIVNSAINNPAVTQAVASIVPPAATNLITDVAPVLSPPSLVPVSPPSPAPSSPPPAYTPRGETKHPPSPPNQTPHLSKLARETNRIMQQLEDGSARVSKVASEVQTELKVVKQRGGGDDLANFEKGMRRAIKKLRI